MSTRARRPPGAPTLSAIAEEIGVTVPTVSKVLNGRSDVSQATRDRVTAQLQRAGYPLGPPTAPSSVPAQRQSDLVDLVVPGVAGSWVTSMMSGVEEVVSAAGRDIVVTVAHDPPGATTWVDRLIARGSRHAVLALVSPTDDEYRRLRVAGVDLVALDPGADPHAAVPTVGATNWAGGYSATEHLLELGHRRIALIAGAPHHRYCQARADGYRSALAMLGLEHDEGLVRFGNWTKSGAAAAAAELLNLPRPPTAIFACSDRMALGVYEFAAAAGVRIPRDLSVVGFDDLPEARWLTPSLTTVRQPVGEMGAMAARILLQLAETHQLPVERHELSTRLVVRDSTGPIELP